jgi:heptosyltransferase III
LFLNAVMSNRTALFLKTKHLGDSVILTSAIAALPPDFVVDVLCFKESEPIFAMNSRVRHVFVVPRHLKGVAKLQQYWATLKEMRNANYDLLAQFSDDWRGAFISRVLKTEISVAFQSKKRPAIWSNSFKQIAKATSTPRPHAEQDVDLLRKVGLFNEVVAPAYHLIVPEAAKKFVGEWLNAHMDGHEPIKLIIIHASARWKFKGLPHVTWAAVIDTLHKRGYTVVITGTNGDLSFNEKVISLCKQKPYLTQDFDLTKTAALMQRANVVASIDSLAIHMASALQTPVVAVFGPTDERVAAPWRVSHRVVAMSAKDYPSFSCRPCWLDGCAGSKVSQCLVAITPKQILEAIDELI